MYMKETLTVALGSLIFKYAYDFSIQTQDALRTFLLRKLDNLTREDKSQITMISTWVTELYLDKVFGTLH